jgi:MoaA/NifB/PqqE/SkfB family radical SAM enzyme
MTLSSGQPHVEFGGLDELWFQVAGTLCNLTCTHCFISCSPRNHSFGMLTLDVVERTLREAERWGVREFYFTGGEPFLNRDLTAMLERTLEQGPASVLTNGTVFPADSLRRLQAAEERSRYSLEFRVSIDGCSAAMNDPIRGPGTFERGLAGVAELVRHGFLPILTLTRVWPPEEETEVLAEFTRVLHSLGYTRPRWKVLPRLQIGAEARRSHGYRDDERITLEMWEGYDQSQLLCQHARVVTSRGVYVCPILLETPEARLGATLNEAARPFAVVHGSCSTCYQHGAICTNPSATIRRE